MIRTIYLSLYLSDVTKNIKIFCKKVEKVTVVEIQLHVDVNSIQIEVNVKLKILLISKFVSECKTFIFFPQNLLNF